MKITVCDFMCVCVQIKDLNLDNCRVTEIEGLTTDFSALESLSMINVGLQSLTTFPKLGNLKKVWTNEPKYPAFIAGMYTKGLWICHFLKFGRKTFLFGNNLQREKCQPTLLSCFMPPPSPLSPFSSLHCIKGPFLITFSLWPN